MNEKEYEKLTELTKELKKIDWNSLLIQYLVHENEKKEAHIKYLEGFIDGSIYCSCPFSQRD